MSWEARLLRLPALARGPQSWILAIALAASATGLRYALGSWVAPTRFITFFVALSIAAFLCGWRQAILVLLLSIAAVCFLFMPAAPAGPPNLAQLEATIAICLVAGGIQIATVSFLRNLIDRLAQLNKIQKNLFSELQHRVANNMQIISAMLRITERDISDPAALELLVKAAARIDGLAQLHRQLYRPSAYEDGLAPVLKNVLSECFYGVPVKIDIDIEPKNLSIDQMTAVVLLVNEAALNAMKHVFRPVQGGAFAVALHEQAGETLVLTVTDDGPGISTGRQAAGTSNSLGMGIMHGFARQLGGQLEILTGMAGTTLRVEFVRN